MKKQILTLGSIAMLGLTAACSNQGYRGPGPVVAPAPVQQAGVDGQWSHTKGIFIANFTNGKFRSIATDTGKPVAIGEYTHVDPNNLRLQWYGGASQSVRKANCNLVSTNYMRCVQTNGSSFEMQRGAIS